MTFSRARARVPIVAAVFLASTLFLWASGPITAAGVPNFHQVSPLIYRGGQPTEQGWQSLAALGVTTVVNLRDEHPGAESAAVEAAGMRYIGIPMNDNGMFTPSAKKVAEALSLLDGTHSKIFIHCHLGSDRTGTVVACYRIEHNHWTAARALREAEFDGMSRMNVGMKHYILHYRPTKVPASIAALH